MIYLDNAATTRVDESVMEALSHSLTEAWGNPSSPHRFGLRAEEVLQQARRQFAASIAAKPEEIVFTSGGTEANNLALKGLAACSPASKKPAQIIISQVEHPSVMEPVRWLESRGWPVSRLPVDLSGAIVLEKLDRLLDEPTALVSVMLVNNEVGTVQPVRAIAERILQKQPHALLHVDAVQAYGKQPVDVRMLGVDAMSFSGHKVHAPKGIGVLFVRKDVVLEAQMHGGAQENDLRSGTENVPGAAALGKAAEIVTRTVEKDRQSMALLRSRLWQGIHESVPETRLNGAGLSDNAAAHILNCSFPGAPGEVMVHALAERQIYASTASACSSRRKKRSHVLTAMFGENDDRIDCSVRFSLSRETTEEEVERAIAGIADAYESIVKNQAVRQRIQPK